MSIFTIFFIVLLVLILGGIPLAVAFGSVALILGYFWDVAPIFSAITIFKTVDSFTLLAVPLFIFGGHLMAPSGISGRLIDFADAIFGKLKGGLGMAGVFSTMIFGAMSGSSVAAVATMGSILIPKMAERGYPKPYTTALVSCSGLLGQLIPPSVPMIIYSMLLGVNVAVLFLSTVIPGLIMALGFCIVNAFICRRFKTRSIFEGQKIGLSEQAGILFNSGKKASLGLLAPVILLGGIYGGVMTATEAAAVAILYIILVGFFGYKTMTGKLFMDSLRSSGRIIGALYVLVCLVVLFGRVLAMENIPAQLADFVFSISDNRYVILIMVNVLLLVVGMLMDDLSGALVMIPVLLPITDQLGISRIHLAAILATNLGAGLMTPPVAPNLFVGAMVGHLSVSDFMRYVWPFLLLVVIPTLILVTYVPAISTWLPRLLLGVS